jgi:hypothetical protein
MGTHPTVHDIHTRYGSLDKPAFIKKFANPFIVVEVTEKPGETGGFKTMNENGSGKRPTEPVSKDREGEMVREMLAVSLEKSGRNSFHNMITLGRATNNDVVVEHPSVSKFHAYFRVNPHSQTLTIADAGSSYGTVVDGRQIRKDEPVPLRSGANIRLADSVRATFLTPADFVDYMHLHLRMSK